MVFRVYEKEAWNWHCKSNFGHICWYPFRILPPESLFQQLRLQANVIRFDEREPELLHCIFAKVLQGKLQGGWTLQAGPCSTVDVAHHEIHLFLRQAVKRLPLGQYIADILMILFDLAFLFGPPRITVLKEKVLEAVSNRIIRKSGWLKSQCSGRVSNRSKNESEDFSPDSLKFVFSEKKYYKLCLKKTLYPC